MKSRALDAFVEAVLYEGHILYPYRPSTRMNRQRFTIGRVYPETYSAAQHGAESCVLQADCLLQTADAGTEPSVQLVLRFLQPQSRLVTALVAPQATCPAEPPVDARIVPSLEVDGVLYQSWQEATEHTVRATVRAREGTMILPFSFPPTHTIEPLRNRAQEVVALLVRRQPLIAGSLEIRLHALGDNLRQLTVRVINRSPVSVADLDDTESVLARTLASTHLVLTARGAGFVSLTDPPRHLTEAAAACNNLGVWPVLIGDKAAGDRDTLLASPIILPDYPQLAPELDDPRLDSSQIEELLPLRILTLADDGKPDARGADARAQLMDIAHARRTAASAEVEPDAEGSLHPALVLDLAPAHLPGTERGPGRRH